MYTNVCSYRVFCDVCILQCVLMTLWATKGWHIKHRSERRFTNSIRKGQKREDGNEIIFTKWLIKFEVKGMTTPVRFTFTLHCMAFRPKSLLTLFLCYTQCVWIVEFGSDVNILRQREVIAIQMKLNGRCSSSPFRHADRSSNTTALFVLLRKRISHITTSTILASSMFDQTYTQTNTLYVVLAKHQILHNIARSPIARRAFSSAQRDLWFARFAFTLSSFVNMSYVHIRWEKPFCRYTDRLYTHACMHKDFVYFGEYV